MSTNQPEGDVADSEELRRFREQWKAELHRTKQADGATPHDAQGSTSTRQVAPANAPIAGASNAPVAPADTELRALELYQAAVNAEDTGRHAEAARLYSQAFRLAPGLDSTMFGYTKEESAGKQAHSSGLATSPVLGSKAHGKKPSVGRASVDGIVGGMEAVKLTSAAHGVHAHDHHAQLPGALAGILRSFPESLEFLPEDENEPVPLEQLPDELLVYVMCHLDATAIERFATVNRKARLVTLDSHIWRPFVQTIYKPPQIAEDEDIDDLLERYGADYRRTYIEQPRIRLDGVYIAVNQYIRHGHSENVWVTLSHLITYHRYLRFYPSGQVISLLANEDQEPQSVIHMLKPTLRMKGLYIGRWRLEGTTVHVTDLTDPSMPDARYTFQMTLELRSRPLGRWNRLDFQEYESVAVATGEAVALPLKKERPFWFSKVRSYA
ncbi:hypothetical protein PENSPDRAFT_655974 [Peniophora sp. CONT]|nr:hypothetical protein PENSPDRAFT_655974 [Peniophora sp. CONT]